MRSDVNDFFLAGHSKEDFEKLLECSLTRIELLIEDIGKLPESLRWEELRSIFPEFTGLKPLYVEKYKNMFFKKFNIGKVTFRNMLEEANIEHEQNKNIEPEKEENKVIELSDEEKAEAKQILNNKEILIKYSKK